MSNENIRQAIRKFIAEEEADDRNKNLDAHNVTVDTFYQTPVTTNTQGENGNLILTSETLNNSDALAETLKRLTINATIYYESFENDTKGNPASDPKVATHNSDGNKRKVTDTRNRKLQQKLLSNRTLPIITTVIDHLITDIVATCGWTTHALTAPTMKGFTTGAVCSRARILRTPGHVSRKDRDSTIPCGGDVVVRSYRDNGPVLIGGIVVTRTMENSGRQDIIKK